MITRPINQVYNHFGYPIRTAVITGVDEEYTYCDLYCNKDIKRATDHKFPHGDEPFEPLTQEERDLLAPPGPSAELPPPAPAPVEEKPKSSPKKKSPAKKSARAKKA